MLGKDLTASPRPWGNLEGSVVCARQTIPYPSQLRTQEGAVVIWLIWVGSQLWIKRTLKENLFVPQRAPLLTLQLDLLRPESYIPGSGARANWGRATFSTPSLQRYCIGSSDAVRLWCTWNIFEPSLLFSFSTFWTKTSIEWHLLLCLTGRQP